MMFGIRIQNSSAIVMMIHRRGSAEKIYWSVFYLEIMICDVEMLLIRQPQPIGNWN